MTRYNKALKSAVPASDRAAQLQDSTYLPSPLSPDGAAAASRMARSAGAQQAPPWPSTTKGPDGPPWEPSDLPTLIDRVDEIVALDEQPVLRNLLITQCYYDLSAELVRLLGGGNAHWASFATWASKTAGRFIRNDEVPSALRKLILGDGADRESMPPPRVSGVRLRGQDEGAQEGMPRFGTFDLFAPWSGDFPGLLDLPERILSEVSWKLAVGNLKVFEELGPLFARMIELYRGCGQPDESCLHALVEGLRPGPSPEGGQDLLRSAMTNYHNALLTDDPDAKAELILLANARIGLHEQVRLQPYIAGALDAPVRLVREAFAGPLRRVPDVLRSKIIEKVDWLQARWCEIATREMMTLRLPNEVLELGRDLPPPPDAPLHSPELATIEDPGLYMLLREYDAHDQTTCGSGATDWAILSERMSYILELFRSRQRYPRLLERPFSREQHRAILAGTVPACDDL